MDIETLLEDLTTEEKIDRLMEMVTEVIDQNDEILEKLDNMSRDGADYSIEVY